MATEKIKLQELCKGKDFAKLEEIADWSYNIQKDEDIHLYWSERDGFEKGTSIAKLNCYDVEIQIEKGSKLILIFANKTFNEVVSRINNIKSDLPYSQISMDDSPLDDVHKISIPDLEKEILRIKNKYGTKSILIFDAGYNNISVEVIPSKKVI